MDADETTPGPRRARTVEVLPPEEPAPSPPLAATSDAGLTRARKMSALAVAAISDAISVFAEFVPPAEWALDVVTAIVLFAVLGFRWPLLPVLVVEAVPGLAAFPTWVLAVGVIAGTTPTKPS